MNDFIPVKHHIQQHIIDVLMHHDVARFRDLRPPKIDTNLFTYHLGSLVKAGVVDKVDGGYALSIKGLTYADRTERDKKMLRTEPKMMTMLVVQNDEGDILLQRREKQPYINTWTLPYGSIHVGDKTIMASAQRVMFDTLGLENPSIEHAGDCYVRVKVHSDLLSNTFVHVFRAYENVVAERDDVMWARPHKLKDVALAPAVEEIMTRTFFKDPFFFEEFDVPWYSEKHES